MVSTVTNLKSEVSQSTHDRHSANDLSDGSNSIPVHSFFSSRLTNDMDLPVELRPLDNGSANKPYKGKVHV